MPNQPEYARMQCCYKHPETVTCQFGNEAATVSLFADAHYCQWHLRKEAKAAWSTYQLEDFERLLQGKLTGLRESGESANFAGVTFPSAIKIDSRSIFAADFRSTIFCADVNFNSASFSGAARFEALYANVT